MNINLNENFFKLKESYLFSEIAKRVRDYSAKNTDKKIIKLGIGDVTLPLTPVVITSMHKAVDEMGNKDSFRGYAPEYGYNFIRDTVASFYKTWGVSIEGEEVFVSDGAKSDLGNIVDILGDNLILIPDPVYPVYLDSNIMSGRKVKFLNATIENNFLPMPDETITESTIIYLCSPNNPTGAVYSHKQLKIWVDYAIKTGSLIIFDSAYATFIKGDLPHSIFEIDGAKKCCIEINSLSKMAGFTGTRCAWTIVPNALESNGHKLNKMWARRQATKFNGVPYIIQRGAEAVFSEKGLQESKALVEYYMENARLISEVLKEKGVWFTGGISSPYIWLKCPNNLGSWEFFDYLLNNAQIVGTPGQGFGNGGEGYFRLTSFGDRENTLEAVERLRKLL
ncbi:MAG: LL-diaminopimelate aminotransferase [Clostridia bacterium]